MKTGHGSNSGIEGLRDLGIEGILSILKMPERSDIRKSSIFSLQSSIFNTPPSPFPGVKMWI
jgi:hypothetical protein